MALNKVNYVDGETVITAENMNDIQDAIIALEETPAQGVSDDLKQALLQLAQKVAYIDDQGQTYYDDLYNALYPAKTLIGITAVFSQGSAVIYNTASLESLKPMLTVTGNYDDGSSEVIPSAAYTLSGTLTPGTSTIVASYNGKTASFNVTVTEAPTLLSITAVYTQSGTVYDTDTLDSLKYDLVVTANYADGTTSVVPATDYTLSGTLEEGVSTITVIYLGKTTTFDVLVSTINTTAVIQTENVVWSATAPNTRAATGFGVTQWYPYEFTQEQLESCQYWDSTNEYMNTEGWAGIKICAPDYLSYQAGHSWPASNNFKHVLGKDGTYTYNRSITRNTVNNFMFGRYSLSTVAANGFSASIPLDDIDYAYAYWYKPMTYSIFPNGMNAGDIIFAGKYTPYYNLENISEAPTLNSISAVFTQGSTVVTESTALSTLKTMLSVTANYDGNKQLPVNLGMVALSGTLTEGTSTITATYNNKTTTFDVTVSGAG